MLVSFADWRRLCSQEFIGKRKRGLIGGVSVCCLVVCDSIHARGISDLFRWWRHRRLEAVQRLVVNDPGSTSREPRSLTSHNNKHRTFSNFSFLQLSVMSFIWHWAAVFRPSGAYLGGLVLALPLLGGEFFVLKCNVENMLNYEHFWKYTPEMYISPIWHILCCGRR